MIKLEVNKGYVKGKITGNPIAIASELELVVRAVRETLEESAGKELGDHLAKRSCEMAFMSREELKATGEESKKRTPEELRKIVEELLR